MPLLLGGGGGGRNTLVEVTVNSKEENTFAITSKNSAAGQMETDLLHMIAVCVHSKLTIYYLNVMKVFCVPFLVFLFLF
jgi:hypothetical protein